MCAHKVTCSAALTFVCFAFWLILDEEQMRNSAVHRNSIRGGSSSRLGLGVYGFSRLSGWLMFT